jgi:hypothetical protein
MSRISATVYLLCTRTETTHFQENPSACQVIRSIYTTYAQIPYYLSLLVNPSKWILNMFTGLNWLRIRLNGEFM